MAWLQAGDYRARPKRSHSEGKASKNWRVQRHQKAKRADLRGATPSSLPWNRDLDADPDYRDLTTGNRQPKGSVEEAGAPPATAWRKVLLFLFDGLPTFTEHFSFRWFVFIGATLIKD